MFRRYGLKYALFSYMVDIIGTFLALEIASTIRITSELGEPISESGVLPMPVVLLTLTVWSIVFTLFYVYDPDKTHKTSEELRRTATAAFFSLLVLAGALYFSYRDISRLLIIYFFILNLFYLLGWRIGARLYFQYSSAHRYSLHRIIVVGTGEMAKRVAGEFVDQAWAGCRFLGYITDSESTPSDIKPVLGGLEEVRMIAENYQVQEVIIVLPNDAHRKVKDLITSLESLPVQIRLVPDTDNLVLHRPTIEVFNGLPLVNLRDPSLNYYQYVTKRLIDIVLSSMLILALLPLLIMIAIAVRIDSPGPIIFRQKRVGQNWQLFTMFKFRSMYDNSDQGLHQAHVESYIKGGFDATTTGSAKLVNDKRITRVGKFIRHTSLDELPQLFNVFKGDMSLVGPRPVPLYEVEQYEHWHCERLAALPGITGLWQVKGRGVVSFDEQIQMDIDYVRKQSVWLDLKLLAMTFPAVLSGRGAE